MKIRTASCLLLGLSSATCLKDPLGTSASPQKESAVRQDVPRDAGNEGLIDAGIQLMRRMGIGVECPKQSACAPGLRCMEIIGVDGVPWRTCELPCELQAEPGAPGSCPSPLRCIKLIPGMAEGVIVSCRGYPYFETF